MALERARTLSMVTWSWLHFWLLRFFLHHRHFFLLQSPDATKISSPPGTISFSSPFVPHFRQCCWAVPARDSAGPKKMAKFALSTSRYSSSVWCRLNEAPFSSLPSARLLADSIRLQWISYCEVLDIAATTYSNNTTKKKNIRSFYL